MDKLLSQTVVVNGSSKSRRHTEVELVLEELHDAWRQDDPVPVEVFLKRHPDFQEEAILRLICEEVHLRRQRGENLSLTEIQERFPQWSDRLTRLLQPSPEELSELPRAGETLGDFQLLEELGKGAQGKVFLARQLSLGQRPVVLKVTPRSGHEHLSLARLQHTHIVPLYLVQDEVERDLRVLCMPYFGNATLHQVLEELEKIPYDRRNGRHVLEVLDRLLARAAVEIPTSGSARTVLAGASYVEAICWMGACLAEALQYAHERGLLHLDLKPSNVLLAADGQPMLLDFHLARPPLAQGDPSPAWLGGTPLFMAPELRDNLADVAKNRPLSRNVDARSDIYSLGVVLYEALGGKKFLGDEVSRPYLRQCNRQVSVGLADLVHRCVARDPAGRYARAGDLAADLRRHLENKPLRGVANRSIRERWGKWRRRRPHGLLLGILFLALTAAVGLAGGLALVRSGEHRRLAENALFDAQELIRQSRFEEAVDTLNRGREYSSGWTGNERLGRALDEHFSLAQRGLQVQQLHALAQTVRSWRQTDSLSHRLQLILEAGCRQTWKNRDLLVASSGLHLEASLEKDILRDLRDLALGLAELRLRLPLEGPRPLRCREALDIVTGAERLCGSNQPLREKKQALLLLLAGKSLKK